MKKLESYFGRFLLQLSRRLWNKLNCISNIQFNSDINNYVTNLVDLEKLPINEVSQIRFITDTDESYSHLTGDHFNFSYCSNTPES